MHLFSAPGSMTAPPVPVRSAQVIPIIKDASVASTIAEMIRISQGCSELPAFRDLGREGLRQAEGVQDKVFRWVRGLCHIYLSFQPDEKTLPSLPFPDDSQLLLTPDLILGNPGIEGACGSYSAFAASLLLATHLPIDIYFTTIAASTEDPSEFSHVYVTVVGIDGVRVPLDCSHGQYVGWEYPHPFRKHNWLLHKGTNYPSIAGDEEMNSYNNLQKTRGMGDIDWGGIIAGAANAGEQIAVNATLPVSTYRSVGPGGTVEYSTPIGHNQGVGINPMLGAGLGASLSSIPPMVWVAGLGLLFLMLRGNK